MGGSAVPAPTVLQRPRPRPRERTTVPGSPRGRRRRGRQGAVAREVEGAARAGYARRRPWRSPGWSEYINHRSGGGEGASLERAGLA